MKTGGFKWWHGLILVAGAAALIFGAYTTLGGNDGQPRMANSLLFVDVTTGDLFTFDVSGRRAVVVPEKNPDTGKFALLGVEKRADGKWYIAGRHLSALESFKGAEAAAVIDRKTGEVRVTSEQARKGL